LSIFYYEENIKPELYQLTAALRECTELTKLEMEVPILLSADDDDDERSWPIVEPSLQFAHGMSTEQRSTALARFLSNSPRVTGVHSYSDLELDWDLLARLLPVQTRQRLHLLCCDVDCWIL